MKDITHYMLTPFLLQYCGIFSWWIELQKDNIFHYWFGGADLDQFPETLLIFSNTSQTESFKASCHKL